jgi:hypothetical protein
MNKLKQYVEYIIEGIYCCFLVSVGILTHIFYRDDKVVISKKTKELITEYDCMVHIFGEASEEVNNFLKQHRKDRDLVWYAAARRKN